MKAPASAAPKYLSDEQFLGKRNSTGARQHSWLADRLPLPGAGAFDDRSGFNAAVAAGAKAAPKYLSDEQFLGGSAPSGPGPLANSSDEGWISGAAKGTATGIIKGISNNLGMVGKSFQFR